MKRKVQSRFLERAGLQYDGRFGVRVGMWNLGSLSGEGEVCEEL